ncbi:hypothetical protein [Paraburkholderia sp. JPY419]|uniref:hypothetical protein n=1 Tax=Paraburkholderia sp. JPY419 TaxID=667660 RepID=UPI003D22EB06
MDDTFDSHLQNINAWLPRNPDRFISTRETISQWAAEHNVTITKAAVFLDGMSGDLPSPVWLHPSGDPTSYGGGPEIGALLKHIRATGNIEEIHDGDRPLSPDVYGWFRHELEGSINAYLDRLHAPFRVDADLKPVAPPNDRQALPETARERELLEQYQKIQNENRDLREELAIVRKLVPRHDTRLLQAVRTVQDRFWGDNWNEDDRDTWPRQDNIVQWLMASANLSSKREAEAVDLVAAPAKRRNKTGDS